MIRSTSPVGNASCSDRQSRLIKCQKNKCELGSFRITAAGVTGLRYHLPAPSGDRKNLIYSSIPLCVSSEHTQQAAVLVTSPGMLHAHLNR